MIDVLRPAAEPRKPPALLAPRVARLAAFAAFATLGSLQWVRYVEGSDAGRAVVWALLATVTGALVIAAGRRPLALAGAVLAGAAFAIAASGIDLTLFEPNHWDELGEGLYRGGEALNSVQLPYLGQEKWVLLTVQLAGAGICWAAAVLACWPDGRGRMAALALLLILVAAPIVSLGSDSAVALGLALAVLTAAFVWMERLARRPGLGLAVLAGAIALAAVPLGVAADRERPWFDYRAFSESLTGARPVSFDWDHEYGAIDWDREGVELFRVDSEEARYWKVLTLNQFDGRLWSQGSAPGDTIDDLPTTGIDDEWRTEFTVEIRALETDELVGAGTTLEVSDSTEEVEPSGVPGEWDTADGDELSEGDSYTARAYVPEPTAEERADATSGNDSRREPALRIEVDLREPRVVDVRGTTMDTTVDSATVDFPPFTAGGPIAFLGEYGFRGDGDTVLRDSYYARTWRLAQRLKREAATPYDYVIAVNEHLNEGEFRYTERPPAVPAGQAPLDHFLHESKAGYCQQYSGAMALMLRMGGVPARVATGFSPGGRRDSGEWVIRDTDAHSWVEVWFDEIGWVTFDPTPSGTPARSQIAALEQEVSSDSFGASDASSGGFDGPRGSGPAAMNSDAAAGDGSAGAADDGGGLPWPLLVAALVLVAAATFVAVRSSRRAATPEGALAELERALRRSGRPAAAGTTLSQLERGLETRAGGYLGALRAARYAPGAAAPDRAQRSAFRRELAAALGRGGRLRALYALPPTLPSRRGPGSSVDRASAS